MARFGMYEEFDMMALGTVNSQYLDGTYSMNCAQETYAAADRAVVQIIRQCHQEAKALLVENREMLDAIAAYLLKKETITGQEMMAILEGKDPEQTEYFGITNGRGQQDASIEPPAKSIHIVSEPIPMPTADGPMEEPEERTDSSANPSEGDFAAGADPDNQ